MKNRKSGIILSSLADLGAALGQIRPSFEEARAARLKQEAGVFAECERNRAKAEDASGENHSQGVSTVYDRGGLPADANAARVTGQNGDAVGLMHHRWSIEPD